MKKTETDDWSSKAKLVCPIRNIKNYKTNFNFFRIKKT